MLLWFQFCSHSWDITDTPTFTRASVTVKEKCNIACSNIPLSGMWVTAAQPWSDKTDTRLTNGYNSGLHRRPLPYRPTARLLYAYSKSAYDVSNLHHTCASACGGIMTLLSSLCAFPLSTLLPVILDESNCLPGSLQLGLGSPSSHCRPF